MPAESILYSLKAIKVAPGAEIGKCMQPKNSCYTNGKKMFYGIWRIANDNTYKRAD